MAKLRASIKANIKEEHREISVTPCGGAWDSPVVRLIPLLTIYVQYDLHQHNLNI